jgi:hypothetical protein
MITTGIITHCDGCGDPIEIETANKNEITKKGDKERKFEYLCDDCFYDNEYIDIY